VFKPDCLVIFNRSFHHPVIFTDHSIIGIA
jgi:hypothetical protein